MSHTLETGQIKLALLETDNTITGFTVSARQGDGWKQMAQTEPLSHLIYQDEAGNRHEADLHASQCKATDGSLCLEGTFNDVDGAVWSLSVDFAVDGDQITADYRLSADPSGKVLRWLGPCLYVGQGSFGTAKDQAVLPGLEYLVGEDVSSDTRFASEKFANRASPHHYKITVPLMAVSHEGCGIGLLWDANQEWGRNWRHPAALFSSPNRLQDNAQNHWLGLFTPGIQNRVREEGQLEAESPAGVDTGNVMTLSARLAASPDDGVVGILRAWVDVYGLPSLPDAGHDYRQNIENCVQSYLDVAWDDDAEGWHHTLADPWGPRFEPLLANQLWRYSRWSEGDPIMRAQARNQVQRAVAKGMDELPEPHNVPRPELALVYGGIADSLNSARAQAFERISEQQSDGSWGWTTDAVADIAQFKTEDRLKVLGAEKDSATGFTSSRVLPVLQYALITGDAQAVEALRKATDWCNAQQRPEGAQTWELHLHVPDMLAVPYLMNINLGMYQLTGEESYLDMARHWAWTGLPFTFLWNGYYRPIMRYGTVPVFGVTFHDVQSWFGVIVHWNGLWYADSLFRLAQHGRYDGAMDWLHLAEGITRHGMQEQATEGPLKGFYPDAFSTVKGDEDYTWWLNPQLIGLNTFPLGGLDVHADPVITHHNGRRLHITSGARIIETQHTENKLRVLLHDQPRETSYTLIAGETLPKKLMCDGQFVPHTEDLDSVGIGYRVDDIHNVMIVKVPFVRGAVMLQATLE